MPELELGDHVIINRRARAHRGATGVIIGLPQEGLSSYDVRLDYPVQPELSASSVRLDVTERSYSYPSRPAAAST